MGDKIMKIIIATIRVKEGNTIYREMIWALNIDLSLNN